MNSINEMDKIESQAIVKSETIQGDMFGVPVDFEIENKVEGSVHTLTISYTSPAIYYDAHGDFFRIFAPPLKEKPISDRAKRLLELFGIIIPKTH